MGSLGGGDAAAVAAEGGGRRFSDKAVRVLLD